MKTFCFWIEIITILELILIQPSLSTLITRRILTTGISSAPGKWEILGDDHPLQFKVCVPDDLENSQHFDRCEDGLRFKRPEIQKKEDVNLEEKIKHKVTKITPSTTTKITTTVITEATTDTIDNTIILLSVTLLTILLLILVLKKILFITS